MFNQDITLNGKIYSYTGHVSPRTSVRSDAARPVSDPSLLTISHEIGKNNVRSTAVILDDSKSVVLGDKLSQDRIRVFVKVQYNPFGGRTDTEATIASLITQLSEFLAVPDNQDKLVNLES